MTVLIGIDPHKGSHTAVAIDRDEAQLAALRVRATKAQCAQLLDWAKVFPQRRWAIESAAGLGYLLAQQLVAAGETVVDIPPTLSARVRVLGSGKSQKNDTNDALSTAIAALRAKRLRTVTGDDHKAILRMLADRHKNLGSARTQAACRLHAKLANLIPGGLSERLSDTVALVMLRKIVPTDGVTAERLHQAQDLHADVRRLDHELAAIIDRIKTAVAAADPAVLEIQIQGGST
jgi:transposase